MKRAIVVIAFLACGQEELVVPPVSIDVTFEALRSGSSYVFTFTTVATPTSVLIGYELVSSGVTFARGFLVVVLRTAGDPLRPARVQLILRLRWAPGRRPAGSVPRVKSLTNVYLPPDVERRMILDEGRWVFELLELPPSSSVEGLELPWTPPAWNVPAHFLLGAVAARAILHETHRRRRYGKVAIWRRRNCEKCHGRAFDNGRLCECATVRIQELES